MDVIRFALLGLGSGAIYAMLADGVVLVYRGSGVLNFAQSAVGMLGAFLFFELRSVGWPTYSAVILGVICAALANGIIHACVMHPLRHASGLTQLLASLGIFTLIESAALKAWGVNTRLVAPLLPDRVVRPLPDTPVSEDRLLLLLIAVAATIVLHLVYSRSTFGLATSAVAENDRALATLGRAPHWIAAANWMMGGALAGIAVILIAPISGLDVQSASLFVLSGLAAALVGGFRSFPLTLLGGLVVGVAESEVSRYVRTPGWSRAAPFLLIIAVLTLRGRPLPLRGELTDRPPEVGTGRVRLKPLVIAVAAAFVLLGFVLDASWDAAAITTMSTAVILLSLVVVTGYCGQISLAQLTLAGMGAWSTSRLMANYGIPAELAVIAGVFTTIPLGIVFALPALRTRGVNLAVTTLGLAVVLQDLILFNEKRTGGFSGTTIGRLRLLGVDITGTSHPGRYACVCLALLVGGAVLVAGIRRGVIGRSLIAVRTNERAATALGINVFAAKLFAFGLSAAIAAVGGILTAFQTQTIVFTQFDVVSSIAIVLLAVIGGSGYVTGAVIGATAAPGGLGERLFDSLLGGNVGQWVRIFTSVTLIVVLVRDPNGIAERCTMTARRLTSSLRRRMLVPEPEQSSAATDPAMARGAQQGGRLREKRSTLEVCDLTVSFASFNALDSVSLSLRPGEVVGLIGPNGAGKTTLIDAITGFVSASAGDILLDGSSMVSWSPRRRAVAGVGRTFQNLELFDSLTVAENLEAAADDHAIINFLRGILRSGNRSLPQSAIEAMDDLELAGDMYRRPGELSFGRQRLVAIARALSANPSVLLLDEPAAGLDNVETSELGHLIRELAVARGLAVLLIEHDVSLVWSVCDRVTVLNYGQVIAEGPPEELRSNPAVIGAYMGSDDKGITGPRDTASPEWSETDLLSTSSMTAGYKDVAAVRDLDLQVRRGEVVALLGPNGAGKSTALRALAGELQPISGTVSRDGEAGWKPTHHLARAGLAFVPQDRSVFLGLTVLENLRLGRGAPEAAFTIFPELRALARRKAGLLSGGEQQMLTLARALAASPSVLLADELSIGLAPMVTERLLDAIRSFADQGGGCLLVEQQFHRALSVADRVYVMNRGQILLAEDASTMAVDGDGVWQLYLDGDLGKSRN